MFTIDEVAESEAHRQREIKFKRWSLFAAAVIFVLVVMALFIVQNRALQAVKGTADAALAFNETFADRIDANSEGITANRRLYDLGIQKPDFNVTGLRPTADGMIMSNGSVNFDALMNEINKTLAEQPQRVPLAFDCPVGNYSFESCVRVISTGVYKYYWRNAAKVAGDLPPWSVINK